MADRMLGTYRILLRILTTTLKHRDEHFHFNLKEARLREAVSFPKSHS